jgi:hypothetical protein
MKIFERVTIDIATGAILEEVSFEYCGPIVELKGSSAPPAPAGPTAEETALTKQQTELVKQQVDQLTKQNTMLEEMWPSLEAYQKTQIDVATQQLEISKGLLPIQKEAATAGLELTNLNLASAKALQPLQQKLAEQGIDLNTIQIEAIKSESARSAALEPVLLEAMGYTKDASGKYIPVEGSTDPIVAATEKRYMSALEGKEGISPALEQELAKEEQKLTTDLSRRLGPSWQTSTPGIQAMSDFKRRSDLVKEEARQSTINQAGGQYLTARGQVATEKQQNVSNIAGLMAGKSSLSSVPTGVNTGTGSTTGVGTGTSSGTNIGGLLGGNGSGAMDSLTNLQNYYQNQRNQSNQYATDTWAYQQGQSSGTKSGMLGGLMGGATIGTSVGGAMATGAAAGSVVPGIGTAIGAGVGLLAGYLLS